MMPSAASTIAAPSSRARRPRGGSSRTHMDVLLYTRIPILREGEFLGQPSPGCDVVHLRHRRVRHAGAGFIIPVWPTLKSFTGAERRRGGAGDRPHVGGVGRSGSSSPHRCWACSRTASAAGPRPGSRTLGTALDYVIMALAPALVLALRRPRALGRHGGQHPYRQRVHRRRHAAREKRAGAYGMISAAFGVGFVVGPALGGWLGVVRSAPAVLGRRGPGNW